jgi:predicted  nucleic acid-binding Zn-ribbon protein
MVACEEGEAALADARAILTQITETWRAEQGSLADEQVNLQTQFGELSEHRQTLALALGAEDLNTYESLRQRKGGRAVAAVRDGICEGCRMSPPSSQVQHARSGPELVFCNNCGRILHVV